MSIEQLALIAVATFVSEDLTCLAAGALVAQGKQDFLPATLACLSGIYAGDLLLFLGGRFARGPVLRFVSEEKVIRASEWISRRGIAVVFLSRFTPGLRLPTYVAAGLLKTKFWRFTTYFLIAAAVWTPLLVGSAALLGSQIAGTALAGVFPALVIVALILRNFSARRALVGFVLRKVRWEFWPAWAAYLPLAPYLIYLACKHRSLTLFTATNPGMPSSGFVGESKSQILERLSGIEGAVARFAILRGSHSKARRAMEFLEQNHLTFPVVLKPDVGECGSGVAIVKDEDELNTYLQNAKEDAIVQEYIPGLEFGVFYIRHPEESAGRIFSITEKRFPEIVGDGQATFRELILRDPRAVCLASIYLRTARRSANDVPLEGERVRLAELGSHCRGAVFLNGIRMKTTALEQAVERVSRAHSGFYFGRFDVRTPSIEAFQRGEFKVIELNGVSAEATHVYDPAVNLLDAYRAMYTQWRTAFEIGSINRRRGTRPMPVSALWRLIRDRKGPGASRTYYHAGTVEVVD